VGPRAGLDELEKRKFFTLPGLELQLLGRPDRSQSLYRLRSPGSQIWRVPANILNKQSRTEGNVWFYSLQVGREAKTPRKKNFLFYKMLHRSSLRLGTSGRLLWTW
jgi:hypothetical protein